MVSDRVMYEAYYKSPIGSIRLRGTKENLMALDFVDIESQNDSSAMGLMQRCLRQLDEYFQGRRKTFELPLAPQGTAFQKRVWSYLLKIRYGNAVSYKTVAEGIGKHRAFRAVGGANNKNPIAIIIPCHRVIGSNGDLTGYGSGLWRKEWLLAHEKATFKNVVD